MNTRVALTLLVFTLAEAAACATGSGGGAGQPAGDATPRPGADSAQRRAAQRTAGSLKQEDVALQFQVRGVHVRMLPLDESVIQLLAPDSYRSMAGLVAAQRERIDRERLGTGFESFSIWFVSFRALEPEARFNPSDVVIRAAGRDFRPVATIPVTAGFGQQRIQQGQSQSALYLFDPSLDIKQPLDVSMEDVRNSEWSTIIRVLDRERTRVRVDTLPDGPAGE